MIASIASQADASPAAGSFAGCQLISRLPHTCSSERELVGKSDFILDLAERGGSTMPRSRLARIPAGGFEEKPYAPFGFVDPALKQACRGHILVLIA